MVSNPMRILVTEERFQLKNCRKNMVGMKSDVLTDNILIKANPKTFDGAFRVFIDMSERGCIPDTLTYATLIDGLCK